MLVSLLLFPLWPLPVHLNSWTEHSTFLFNIILSNCIRLYFHHQSYPQRGVISALALPLHFSGALSAFPRSILDTYWPGGSSFSVISFAFLYCSWGSQGKNAEVVGHSFIQWPRFVRTLSMTHLSWVDLYNMAPSFIELHKAVAYVVILVSFLWLWFSFCLPSNGWE